MDITLKASTRIFFSSILETVWATAVGAIAGRLST